jgi:hypothetical protein
MKQNQVEKKNYADMHEVTSDNKISIPAPLVRAQAITLPHDQVSPIPSI